MPAAVTLYPRLPTALVQEAVQATPLASPDDLVKTYLLNVTSELLTLQSSTTSLGASSTDRYRPSLHVLHARLQHGKHSPFPGLENRSGESLARMGKENGLVASSAMERPLADFEDMYYAILATVKETHESIILRLNNGFVAPDALLFPSSQYTLHFFQEWLTHQWTILNEPSLVLALDVAVRKALVDGHLCHALRTQVDSGKITQQEAEVARANLYQSDVLAEMPGLSWVGNEHSAMINGRLNEKYRLVFQAEKLAYEKKARWAKNRDRLQKAAKNGSKAGLRRGSGEYRAQQRRARAEQVHAEQVQQVAHAVSETTEQSTHRKEVEKAVYAHDNTRESLHIDQHGVGAQLLLQGEAEAWRLYTQQKIFSQRETQMHQHDGELPRKTASPAPEEAMQTLTDSLCGEAVSHTLQGQTHERTVTFTQPQKTVSHHDTRQDTDPADHKHCFPGPSPHPCPRGTRAQRVTEYQVWLRQSASEHARRRMGMDQAQARIMEVGNVSRQVLNRRNGPTAADLDRDRDRDMDMDMDMGEGF